jgi:hypothetical protein
MQRIVYPKLIYSWMLLLACACGGSGQTISADKLLKQASQSLGGEKVFRAITTRQAKGTFTQRSDGRSGKMQITTQHPNFYLKTTELDGFETAEAYSGKSSWQRDLRQGLRTRVGQDSFDFQFAAPATAFRTLRPKTWGVWASAKATPLRRTISVRSPIKS